MTPLPGKGRSVMRSEGDLDHVTIKVGGMTCGGCTSRVKHSLEALDGVVVVDVDLEEGQAKVGFDHRKVTITEMHEAIERTGYSVED